MLILLVICIVAVAVMTIVYLALEIADISSARRYEQLEHLILARMMIDELGGEDVKNE